MKHLKNLVWAKQTSDRMTWNVQTANEIKIIQFIVFRSEIDVLAMKYALELPKGSNVFIYINFERWLAVVLMFGWMFPFCQ